MNKKGFTLIEVLVVIAIIGILSGIIIANMGWAVNSANDARRKSNIDEIRKSVVYYKTQSVDGLYPIEADECTIGGGDTPCSALASALSVILPTPPVDPVSGAYYTYHSEDGTDFTVSSTLSDSTTYSYTASTGFSTEEAPSYASTCASATNSQVQCTETTDGSYVIDTFTYLSSSGTTSWTVPNGVTSVEYLVVGGGGGGGRYLGGGGGGGGFLTGTLSVSGSVSVIVGAGGTFNNNGGNSTFSSITASGGGAGGANSDNGNTGGSGGGGGADGDTQRYGGSAVSGQGYAGGNGEVEGGGSEQAGGGGGGAGGIGTAAGYASGGDGGIGLQSNITGSLVYYAGGGGGMVGYTANHVAVGGNGGGANGVISDHYGSNGTDGLGGGGGGGALENGGTGGSGVVIVRFLHP